MTYDDVLIVGSGVAALQLAALLNKNLNVRIITKSKVRNANSYLAQGGIAAAIGKQDHPSKHYMDTLKAGRFHNNEESVRKIVNEAPALIREIFTKGSVFDMDSNGEMLLGMEGAHSEKRIVHSGGDATGKNVVEYLIGQLKDNASIEEDVFAYELIVKENRCIGVKTKKPDGEIQIYYANNIVLATGGCGQLYTYTSNAETVTGDGIAMAYLAGAQVADMEFNQFHPTLLYINGETKGLVSEAVRGEGAILITEDGTPIMEGVHPLKDLAPRHVVSQKIYEYVSKGKSIYLDIHSIPNFSERFPSITEICEENGVDLAAGRIPVVPGSHFIMGGIKTDLIGRTSINGLFAIGESSCTGLHGANRLASNSLLEGLYQGKKLSEWFNQERMKPLSCELIKISSEINIKQADLPEKSVLQNKMMEHVGIVRNKVLLEKQKSWLAEFNVNEIKELDAYSINDIERIFMVIVAELITESALKRTESRGGHYRSDYPKEDDGHWLHQTITHIQKREEGNSHEQIQTIFTA
jgi:L-aspartate oxidase